MCTSLPILHVLLCPAVVPLNYHTVYLVLYSNSSCTLHKIYIANNCPIGVIWVNTTTFKQLVLLDCLNLIENSMDSNNLIIVT